MAVYCQNCGNQLQDPGGSLVGRHCSICHSTQLVRTGGEAPPPEAFGGALVGALLGAAAFGGGGALLGGLVGLILASQKSSSKSTKP